MKHLLKMVGLAAVVMATVACTDKVETKAGYGEIRVSTLSSPKVSLKNVAQSDNTYTIDGLALPSGDDFALDVIYDLDGSKQGWASITDFGNEKHYFTEGNYTIKVAHGNPEVEGFDIEPYFAGEKAIVVEARKTTEAVVPAYIGHSLVVVECTDKFNNYFTSSKFKVTTLAGGEFDVTLPMTQNLFIRPQQFSIDCTAVKQTGEEISLPTQTITEVNPQTRYTVKFDVAEAGGATVEITLNDTIIGNVSIDKELNDDAIPE